MGNERMQAATMLYVIKERERGHCTCDSFVTDIFSHSVIDCHTKGSTSGALIAPKNEDMMMAISPL